MRKHRASLNLTLASCRVGWVSGARVAALAVLLFAGNAAAQQVTSSALAGPGAGIMSTTRAPSLGSAASTGAAFTSGPRSVATAGSSDFGGAEGGGGGYFATAGPTGPAMPSSGGSNSSLLTPLFQTSGSGGRIGGGQRYERLPLAIPGFYGATAMMSNYQPYANGPVYGDNTLAVPTHSNDEAATMVDPSQRIKLSDVLQRRLLTNYARLSQRGWDSFRTGDYQRALRYFRSVEEVAIEVLRRDSGDGSTVQQGMLLAYMADGSFAASGQQMVRMLQYDPYLLSPARRSVLDYYGDKRDAFQKQRDQLARYVQDGGEPASALALVYCIWLEGNLPQSIDMAQGYARQMTGNDAQIFQEFIRRAQNRPNTVPSS